MENKEIQEILKIICPNIYTKLTESCEKCHLKNYCATIEKAKRLYNAGYRNCKDKVILTRKEYEDMI